MYTPQDSYEHLAPAIFVSISLQPPNSLSPQLATRYAATTPSSPTLLPNLLTYPSHSLLRLILLESRNSEYARWTDIWVAHTVFL